MYIREKLIWKLYEIFKILQIQKRIVSAETFRENTVKRKFQCVMGDGREWNLIELPLIKTDPVFAVTSKSPQSKINPKE
jgi:hypothetical protein